MSIEKNITDTLSRSVCGGWDRGFLESVLDQIGKGRILSVKQKQTLGKILARNTEESQKEHENWQIVYVSDYKPQALVLAAYHVRQPYYRPMAGDILAGKVPARSKFMKMYDNKYSKKVLAQHDVAAKYSVGDYLRPRAALVDHKHVEFECDTLWVRQNKIVQSFKRRGGFVIEISADIHSAAKGAKRYKLLTVGETTPIIIEERFLKKASVKK